MLAPAHILLAAAAAYDRLTEYGDVLNGVELGTFGFRFEGTRTRAGTAQRLVVEAVSTTGAGVELAIQVGGRTRRHRAHEADFRDAVASAIDSLTT